jgi:cell division protein FtsL
MTVSEDIFQWVLLAICLVLSVLAVTVATAAFKLRGEVRGLERYIGLLEQMVTSLLINHSQENITQLRRNSDDRFDRSRTRTR